MTPLSRRGRRNLAVACLVGGIAVCPLAPATGAVDDLELVSRSSAGAPGSEPSRAASISADGRYVAFESFADELSAEDLDQLDVFVRDLQTGTTTLVSRQSAADGGAGADGVSDTPAISADGRFVAFESVADNLAGPTAVTQVFVRDLQAQTTTLVSRQSDGDGGDPADASALIPSISADGRFVAFESVAGNLSTEDDDPARDVFVRDLQTGTTTLASRQSAADGEAGGDGNSFVGRISADGRVVAFRSTAENLSAEDTALTDVFVRDLDAGTTTLASRATGAAGAAADASSSEATMSSDGRVVAFITDADNLSADDDTVADVFVRDLNASTTTLATRADGPAGAAADGTTFDTSMSGDGRFVAFSSNAANLSDADVDPVIDAFVRDLVAGTTKLVSRQAGPAGAGGDASSEEAVVSADGRYVAFESLATNLSAEDADAGDVFRRDVLGPPPPPAPPVGGAVGTAAATSASDLCAPAAPAARRTGGSGEITLSVAQLAINQRIGQAAIRRLNAVSAWLGAGVQGRDICGGTIGPAELAAGIATAPRASAIAALQAADPRPVVPAAARPDPDADFTLSARQLLINQRIYQAGVRRANALEARLAGGLTGGDVVDGAITQGKLHDRLAITAAPAVAPAPASRTILAAARRGDPASVALTAAQLTINQRVAQAAVRRSNALIGRLDRGLTSADLRDGTLGSADLAAGLVLS